MTGGTLGASVCYVEHDVLDLAKRFFERQIRTVEVLRQAAREKDFEAIRKAGHDLKGSGGAYGLDALSQLGTELENAAGARSGDWVELLITRLEQQLLLIELRAATGESQEIATEVNASHGSLQLEPSAIRE